MQNPALRIEGKGKTVHSSRLKSGEQIRKNRKLAGKNGEAYFISLISNLQKYRILVLKKDLEIICLNFLILLMRKFREVKDFPQHCTAH